MSDGIQTQNVSVFELTGSGSGKFQLWFFISYSFLNHF